MPARSLVFRPLVETRIACALPGLVIAVAASAAARTDVVLLTMIAVVVGLGVVLAVRGYRMAVIVAGRVVTVRGLLRSRVIPRAAVEALRGDVFLLLADAPTLSWHDETGKVHRTRLWMFGEPGRQFADVTGHNRRSIDNLRTCLGVSHAGDRRLRRR